MIRILQCKLPVGHSEADMKKKIEKLLKVPDGTIKNYTIIRRSLDARKKPELYFNYVVDVKVSGEEKIVKRCKNKDIQIAVNKKYQFPKAGEAMLAHSPVIIGTGPAGLFCGYMLAKQGYAPILLERGEDIEKRTATVDKFWKTGTLNPESNVQFGEGGAGTFSDGKLNTLVKDKYLRNRKVLEIFVEAGAPEEILYLNKPHIGTDILKTVVQNIRKAIIAAGGEVRFQSKVTDFLIENGVCKGVVVNGEERILADVVVCAIGHSARDTFLVLREHDVPMEPKPFAVGVRIEHPQSMINQSQYGVEKHPDLSAADYKVTKTLPNGRSIYSFCMCPGGYVVNASSEQGRLAVNGMSYHDRAGKNANSAMIVTVTPEDFGSNDVLAGMEFQRSLEEKAYEAGKGAVPVQTYGDFCKNIPTKELGEVTPSICGEYTLGEVRPVFPESIQQSIEEGIHAFGKMIVGFDREDALLSGVESRTSSPVRILRDACGMSEIKGLYPCGEGAGYAGGITSAAMDGIKIAEEIVKTYQSLEN